MTSQINSQYSKVVLGELNSSLKSPDRKVPTSTHQEIEALNQLVEKAKGVPPESENQSNGQNPRMTKQELKAMKSVSGQIQEPKVKFIQKFSHILVKAWLTVKSWFVYKDAKRKVCQQIGHECANCGMTVPFQHEPEPKR